MTKDEISRDCTRLVNQLLTHTNISHGSSELIISLIKNSVDVAYNRGQKDGIGEALEALNQAGKAG